MKLAVPIMISQVGQLLLNVVDSIMIGHVGIAPLGASAFGGAIFSFFLVFGFGVLGCVSPLMARFDGSQNVEGVREVFRHGVFLGLALGVILAGSIVILSFFLELFDQPIDVLDLAAPYLVIMAYSLVPALLFHVFRQTSEALGRPVIVVMIVMAAVALNAFLNWLWIFGNWGFSPAGLVGAGWATFTTRILMFLGLWIYVYRHPTFTGYLPLVWRKVLNVSLIREMLRIGLSSGFQTLFEVGAFVAAAVMMGWLGTQVLAAHQVALSVVSMTFMVTMGISFAVSIRVGHALGRGDIRAARRLGFGGIVLGGLWMGLFGIAIYAFKDLLPRIYVDDTGVMHLATSFLVMGAIFQIFDGIQGVAIGALRGMGDVKIPTLITFVVYWVITLPLVYLLGFKTSLEGHGVWMGLTVGLILAAIMLTSRFDASTRRFAPPDSFLSSHFGQVTGKIDHGDS